MTIRVRKILINNVYQYCIMNKGMIYNEYFELIHLMKRKQDCLTDDELIIFEYMFDLMKAKMNENEKMKLKEKTKNLKRLLEENYEYL